MLANIALVLSDGCSIRSSCDDVANVAANGFVSLSMLDSIDDTEFADPVTLSMLASIASMVLDGLIIWVAAANSVFGGSNRRLAFRSASGERSSLASSSFIARSKLGV
ncbi:hypothetical protein D3C87_1197060 [compost metagenome]